VVVVVVVVMMMVVVVVVTECVNNAYEKDNKTDAKSE
jgi:hypothetical protein